MRVTEGQSRAADGLMLFTRTWLPDSTPRGVLAMSHGGGEHSGRYTWVGEALSEAGYVLHMADLRGHGKSQGKRGHVMSWAEYRADFDAILQGARAAAPGAPLFIVGHSLGGLLAASAALDASEGSAAGVVLSSPFFQTEWEPGAMKLALARLLSNVTPRLTLANGITADMVSRAPEVIAAYSQDPLVHDRVSVRAAQSILGAQQQTLAQAERLRVPLLLLLGTEDRLATPAAGRAFYGAVSSIDKALHIYDGLYHELLNEPERDDVLADIIQWLDAHTNPL